MSRAPRTIIRSLLPAAAALALLAPAAGAETVTPLPESNYATRAACGAPQPGFAACTALQLIPLTAEARRRTHPLGIARNAATGRRQALTPAGGFLGLRPQDLHTAYALPTSAAGAETIALVDAYNDVTAEADLKTYDEEFGLPACTTANGCFKKIGQTGSESEVPFPKSLPELETASKGTAGERHKAEEAIGWGVEISLDVQTAHAICQSCKILLVEATNTSTANLAAAERRAELLGASVISNSWGAPEEFVGSSEREAFNHPETVITASAGDSGYREWDSEGGEFTSFPASHPDVVAVGGTRLHTLGIGGGWQGEAVWNGSGASGGGCSTIFAAPAWQLEAADWGAVGCGPARSANDVSADADPYTGVVIRDTDLPGEECEEAYEEAKEPGVVHTIPEWCTYGGTSLASPIVASVFALAGAANGVAYPARTLYRSLAHSPAALHDVTVGSNGACGSPFDEETGLSTCSAAEEAAASCSSTLACLAAPGYDGPSGVGTPDGILAFVPGAGESGEGSPPSSSGAPASSPGPAAAPAAPVAVRTAVFLTSLGLTSTSVIALDHRPSTAKVSFAFTSNMIARLRVSLARRVRSHHRTRWVAVGRATSITALPGRNLARLRGARRLGPGLYRLTLTPSSGKPRSILFHIG